jgi:hypothetical protein
MLCVTAWVYISVRDNYNDKDCHHVRDRKTSISGPIPIIPDMSII